MKKACSITLGKCVCFYKYLQYLCERKEHRENKQVSEKK